MGADYKTAQKKGDLRVVGNEQKGMAVLCKKEENLGVDIYDTKTLEPGSKKEIETPAMDKSNTIGEAIYLGNSIYWIRPFTNKKSQKVTYSYDKINIERAVVEEDNIPFLERDFPAQPGFLRYGTDLVYNEKKEKLLFYNWTAADKFGLFVFDEKMKQVWGREVAIPFEIEKPVDAHFSLDAIGNVYLLAKVKNEGLAKDLADGKSSQYQLLKITKDSVVNIPLGFNKPYYITEVLIAENLQQELVISCTYSKRDAKRDYIDGLFTSTINKEGNVVNGTGRFYEFPLEEMMKYESGPSKKKMQEREDLEIPTMKIRHLILEADGSVMITCEQYFKSTSMVNSSTGSMGSGGITSYFFGYIIATKINAAGELEWIHKIPKYQIGEDVSETMGFALMNTASSYTFLYMDDGKNVGIGNDDEPLGYMDGGKDKGQFVVMTIDKKGSAVTTEILYDAQKEGMTVAPLGFIKLNDNQFAGIAKGKKDSYTPFIITVY